MASRTSIPIIQAHTGKQVGTHNHLQKASAKNANMPDSTPADIVRPGNKGKGSAVGASLAPGKINPPTTGGAPTAAKLPAVGKSSGKPIA